MDPVDEWSAECRPRCGEAIDGVLDEVSRAGIVLREIVEPLRDLLDEENLPARLATSLTQALSTVQHLSLRSGLRSGGRCMCLTGQTGLSRREHLGEVLGGRPARLPTRPHGLAVEIVEPPVHHRRLKTPGLPVCGGPRLDHHLPGTTWRVMNGPHPPWPGAHLLGNCCDRRADHVPAGLPTCPDRKSCRGPGSGYLCCADS